jgi:dynein intermediate chain 2, axonemal
MEIVFVYQRLRKDFGRAPKFHDLPADILAETMPNPDLKDEYVERNPTDVGIQCIPEYSEHEVCVHCKVSFSASISNGMQM